MTKKEKYNNIISTQYNGKAKLSSLIPYVEYDGGYWIYSNHKEIKTIHEDNTIEITYEADVVWDDIIAPEPVASTENQDLEALIQAKIREQAIEALKLEGKL